MVEFSKFTSNEKLLSKVVNLAYNQFWKLNFVLN